MRLDGSKRLVRQLRDLPDASRSRVGDAIKRSTKEGERIATALAPDVTHETRGNIFSEVTEDGLRGEVIAIRSDAPREDKDRAYSIEFGRKRGERGTTAGYHFMRRARAYLAKRHRGRVKRAIRQAAKEVSRG